MLSSSSQENKVVFIPPQQRVSKKAIGKQADGVRKAYLMLQVKMNQSLTLTKIKKDRGEYGMSEVVFWISL